jgi:hypothetical protein
MPRALADLGKQVWPVTLHKIRPSTVSDFAFFGFAGVILAAYLVLIKGQLTYGLEYDESYLLSVAANIADGQGFIDDGVSFWTSGTPFDPNISTGPVLLVPGAIAWKISGGSLALIRLVPVCFFVLFMAATAFMYYRWRGRWVAAGALIGPLLLPVLTPDLANQSLMPGRFVGEIAAAALLLTAAVFLSIGRDFAAGVIAGLAILAKLNFTLPVLVLLLAWLITRWAAHRSGLRHIARQYLLGAVIPLSLFEFYKLLVLGFSGYWRQLSLLADFTAQQSVPLPHLAGEAFNKAVSLMRLTSGPVIAVALALIIASICILLLFQFLNLQQESPPREDMSTAPSTVVAVSLTALFIVASWVLTSSQASLRPAIPGVLIVTSLTTASLVIAAWTVWERSSGRIFSMLKLAPVLAIGLLIAVTAYQGLRIDKNLAGQQLLQNQEQAAAIISREVSELPVDGFWTSPEFSVLTGLPYSHEGRNAPELVVLTSIRALLEVGRPDATALVDLCGEILYESRDVVLCRPLLGA